MQVKDRENALLKNTGILALGTLCSKFLSFFLLPLYTNVLSTEDYGNVDVLQSFSSVAIPIVTLQLSSAIFRFLIDKTGTEDKQRVITTGALLEISNILIFSSVMMIADHFMNIQYFSLFILYFSSLAFLEIIQNIVRGFGNNVAYSVMSFLMTAISLISNLVMILGFHMKGDSILIASSLAYLSAAAFGIWAEKIWRYIDPRRFSVSELKAMLEYCLPLIPNAVSWWVANTSDRFLIRIFIGAGANGVYAAANKIPTIFTTIFNVFNIAWIEALARSAGKEEHIDFINSMFKKSVKLFGCICIGMISCMSLFFGLMIGAKYADAYWHVAILLVAIFFNALCSLLGGVFTAYKKSAVIGRTTVIGAVVNFLINIMLIRKTGLYAASVSTLVSYIVIMIFRIIYIRPLFDIKWPSAYLIQYAVMLMIVLYGYAARNTILNAAIFLIVALWSVYQNKEMLLQIVESIMAKLKKSK